jgi:AcrR family transcriptional regulator
VPAPDEPAHRRRHDADSVLDVAVALFTERGYDGTSMGDVAAAAGLSKSSLYHHVPSKEQLLRLALERAVDPLFAVTREPGAVRGPAVDRLEHVVRREVHVLVEHLPFVTLLLRVHGNTETERWALRRRREFDRLVAALMARAVAEGDVRADVDAALVTRLLFGMVNSLVGWYRPDASRRARGTATVDELADSVVRLAFDGLRRERAATPDGTDAVDRRRRVVHPETDRSVG